MGTKTPWYITWLNWHPFSELGALVALMVQVKIAKKNQAACPSILHTHTKVSAAPKSIPTLQKKLRIREVKPSQLGSKTAYGRKVGMAQLQNDPGHKISLVFLRISDIILQAKKLCLDATCFLYPT